MKKKVELEEDELKEVVAKALGMEGAEVTFYTRQCTDELDRPYGGYYVSCEVVQEEKRRE